LNQVDEFILALSLLYFSEFLFVMTAYRIYKVQILPLETLTAMVAESQRTGFRAIQRLVDEWESGQNRFDRPGEALFIAQSQTQTIGICGLNIDPYTRSASSGRVRRLYVTMEHRRNGIGHALVERVIAEARLSFTQLQVRTDNPIADRIYRSFGFRPHSDNPHLTHLLLLTSQSPVCS
jgi:ribosomal protein S18 acetylase RimI-like enzyme